MSLPYMALYIKDFEADTTDLSILEDGAYNRLLRLCWRHPRCRVPSDEAWLFRKLRATTPEEQAAVRTIVAEYFKTARGYIFNRKQVEVYDAACVTHASKSEAGKKGAAAKALKKQETGSGTAEAELKQPKPKPKPESIGGGGSAREGDEPTDREQILAAIGADPVSGLAGPNGRRLGTQADMAEADRWLALPGLTMPVICAEIRRIMSGKTDGPPASFRYFTVAMQRLSAAMDQPALTPLQVIPGGKSHVRPDRANFDTAHREFARRVGAGEIDLRFDDGDPFASGR